MEIISNKKNEVILSPEQAAFDYSVVENSIINDIESAYSEVEGILGGFSSTLNLITAEIKNLESNLRKHGLCIPVFYKIKSSIKYNRDIPFDVGIYLAWIEDDKKSYRLMYTGGDKDLHDDGGMFHIINPESLPRFYDTVPLLETKAQIRYGIRKHLPGFIYAVRDALKFSSDNPF